MLGWKELEVPLTTYIDVKTAQSLAKVGVHTVADLLEWFPRRYVEHGSNSDLGDLEVGARVTFIGEVVSVRSTTTRTRKRLFTAQITDGSHTLEATFFNAFVPQKDLKPGTRAMFMATLGNYRGTWQLSHPDYKIISFPQSHTHAPRTGTTDREKDLYGSDQPSGEHADSARNNENESSISEAISALNLLPIYPTRSVPNTKNSRIDSWAVLETILELLRKLPPIGDFADSPIRIKRESGSKSSSGKRESKESAHGTSDVEHPHGTAGDKNTEDTFTLPTLNQAIRHTHIPSSWPELTRARQRLAFNEALGLQLVMALRRADAARRPAPVCASTDGYRQQLVEALPFELTSEQDKVLCEISEDLRKSTPMSRLLQGDVGSGKTIVAVLSMLQAVDSGHQAALLAPTEVLAQQHARSLIELFSNAGIPATVSLLTGSMSQKNKQEALLSIMSGQTDIVVGTHALLSDGVEFFDLGLTVIDEQHRFGVEQRDRLRGAGRVIDSVALTPHQLVMTATPIPRTIAMTTFGDLDVSTIESLPTGREPIRSAVVPEWKPSWLTRAYERMDEEIEKGRQIYIVCPRIDGIGGVEEIFEELSAYQFSHRAVALLHGRMSPADKDATMTEFAAGRIDVLVSTTVIEVGVDVPNASIMMIREAERFGVSQLHQLRGRVGRGAYASWCFFHTEQEEGSDSYRRLTTVAQTTNGFTLAELDLTWRSEGDLIGGEQSGRSSHIQMLDVVRDQALIRGALDYAEDMVKRDREAAERLVTAYTDREKQFLEKG